MEPATPPGATAYSKKEELFKTFWQKVQPALLPLFAGVSILLVYLVFRYSPIPPDASYYLVVSRDISNGIRPYIDVEVVYTPLALYLNSLVFLLTENFDYSPFIFLQLLVVAACSFVLYLICLKRFYLQKRTSLFLALLFFSAVLSFEGYYIVTEPYVAFFILLSFFICFPAGSRWAYVMSGVILAFSFFSKQYGLFAVLPFCIVVYAGSQKKTALLYFIAAYSITVLCFFILSSSGNPALVFNQVFGQPMRHKSKNLNDLPSLIALVLASKIFILTIIPLLIGIARKAAPLSHVLVFCFMGILMYWAPLLVNQYQHYFINALPFVFIAYAYTLKKGNYTIYEKAVLVVLFFSYSSITVNRLRIHAYKKEEQASASRKASSQFAKGDSVFIMGQVRYLYLLNGYQDPLKRELNYTWNEQKIAHSKNLLHSKKVIFSYCYEKQLIVDSLKVTPKQFMSIEDCAAEQ